MPSSDIHNTTSMTSMDNNTRSTEWRRALWLTVIYLAFLLFFYSSSFLSMVSIWQRSDTFAHGFIIPLISLWLMYRAFPRLKIKPLNFSYLGIAAVLVGVTFWLIGNLSQVVVLEQLSVVFMLVSGVVAIIGLRAAKVIAFPLLFLFMMVPMGEELIAPMMEFTATSTVWLIRWVGIPVYREGLYFSLPSGNWSVVEACSGVRYLIASFALGLLYAYLTYQALYKRLLFIIFSIIVPVLANSVRAFMIVMIGHYSDMQYAVGVDHLIYGWLFFGVVIFLMFWLGNFFSDDVNTYPTSIDNEKINASQVSNSKNRKSTIYPSRFFKLMLGTTLLVLVYFQSISNKLMPNSLSIPQISINAPKLEGLNVQFIVEPWSWRSNTPDADKSNTEYYQFNGQTYALYSHHYIKRKRGSELVNSLDKWISKDSGSWKIIESGYEKIVLNQQDVSIERVILSDGISSLFAWRWYNIGERLVSNRYQAKLYEFLALFDSSNNYSSRYYLATKIDEANNLSRHESFLEKLIPKFKSEVSAVKSPVAKINQVNQ